MQFNLAVQTQPSLLKYRNGANNEHQPIINGVSKERREKTNATAFDLIRKEDEVQIVQLFKRFVVCRQKKVDLENAINSVK